MATVELFDRKKRVVVDSLVASLDDSTKINQWLAARGLTLSDGRVMDVRTLPFGKTNFILRDSPMHPRRFRNPHLDALRTHLEAYRAAKGKSRGLVEVIADRLQEVMVRGAIDDCRKNGVSEMDIIAVLGENADLAAGGTGIKMVVKVG